MKWSKVEAIHSLSTRDKLLLAEVSAVLLLSKLAVTAIPFKRIAAAIGVANCDTERFLTNDEATVAARIRYFMFMASANVPWTSVCLDQALATTILLNRRKLPNTLFLGLKINAAEKKLKAHAWVECNNKIFVGGIRSKAYQVVASFSKY